MLAPETVIDEPSEQFPVISQATDIISAPIAKHLNLVCITTAPTVILPVVKVKVHNIVTVKLCLGFHAPLNIGWVMPDQPKGSAEQIQVSALIARTATVIRHTIRAVFFTFALCIIGFR